MLEVGFDRTAPNFRVSISSWAFEKGIKDLGPDAGVEDNRAIDIACYDPKFTFVEKLQAIITKFTQYKDGKNIGKLPINFLRHYYDIYCLLDLDEIKNFIGSNEYEEYKKERFRKYDTKIKNCEGFTLPDATDRKIFEDNYKKSSALYLNIL